MIKDIRLDEWTNKDIKQLLMWIDAIDNNKKINIKEWDMSMLGSIQIKDIRFSRLKFDFGWYSQVYRFTFLLKCMYCC